MRLTIRTPPPPLAFQICLILALALLDSCSEEAVKTQETYPLRQGTRWDFGTFTDTVLAGPTLNGKAYATISPGHSLLGSIPAVVRMNSAGQLVILFGDAEQVLFDFEASVGSTWVLSTEFSDYQVHVLQRNLQNIVVPAGTFNGCYLFQFHGMGTIDDNWEFVVCPKIGVVLKSGGVGIFQELVNFSPGR